MSREEGKRRQAQELLHALTDIDDRFLMEALGDDLELDDSVEYDPERVQVKLPGMSDAAGTKMQGVVSEMSDAVGIKTQETLSGMKDTMAVQAENTSASGKAAAQAENTSASGKADAPMSGTSAADSDKVTRIEDAAAKKRSGLLRKYSAWALTAAACLTVVVVGRHVKLNSVKDSPVPAIESEWRGDSDDGQAAKEAESVKDAASVQSAGEAAEAPTAEMQSAGEAAEAPTADMQSAGEAAEAPTADMQSADEAAEVPTANLQSAAEAAAEADGNMSDGAGLAVGSSLLATANPFIDVPTIKEAEDAAGFAISLPKEAPPYDTVLYRAIQDEMIEVIYTDADGNEGYRVRKAVDTGEEISGDYTQYEVEDTLQTEDGIKVTVKGSKKDNWSVALWNAADQDSDSYAYAICGDAKTFTSDEILSMVGAMTAGKR